MTTFFQFLTYIVTNHGYWALTGIVGLITIILSLMTYLMFWKSSLGRVIDRKMAEKEESDRSTHIHGNRLRKQFTVAVQEILQDLAEETNANRAVLFEFSNGTTNLVGLPFTFITAAAEVATPGLSLMAQRHQRLNTSVIASFLARLEREGSIYVDIDAANIGEFSILGQIMHNADLNTALFYSIQGIDEAIGFLVILTTKASGNKLDLTKSLLLLNKASQRIGSMINFDEITERERKRNKWKWIWEK